MSLLAEGTWSCTVLSAASGADKGIPYAQIKVRIDDGPSAGRVCTYEQSIDARSSKYAGYAMRAVGWAGKTIESLAADCAAWVVRTGGKSTVEITHLLKKKGKDYDKWIAGGQQGPQPIWDKVNSIGKRTERTLDKLSGAALAEANEALARAMAEGGSAPDDAPPPTDDDLPFVSTREPRGIARVIGGVL